MNQKSKLRIGQLAKQLKVKEFVVRFWEKEFNISPKRSNGGQRFYTEEDAHKLQIIKELLYDKGFTIAGAKNYMKNSYNTHNVLATVSLKSQNTNSDEKLTEKIVDLQKKLIKLRELL